MKSFSFSALLLLLGTVAMANDGGISLGGSPGLVNGHPSVRMEKEVIRMTVGEQSVTVDCRFTFTNHGPATTVRMGFPDYGLGANDPYEERNTEWDKTKPVSVYTSFRSWVDGKRAPTELVRSKVENQAWQAKMVTFDQGQTREVRDLYTMPLGGGVFDSAGSISEAGYVLHTGASWHGSIGSTLVVVTFNRKDMPGPLRAIYGKSVEDIMSGKVGSPASKNEVICAGPGNPTASGKTLTFKRTNWIPTESDDIYLFFNYRRMNDGNGK